MLCIFETAVSVEVVCNARHGFLGANVYPVQIYCFNVDTTQACLRFFYPNAVIDKDDSCIIKP